MAYCPKCGVEYRESAAECMDCRAPLQPGPPPPPSGSQEERHSSTAKLICIRVFSGPTSLMQADLARNLLETEDIPCVLQGHVMGEILPGVEPIQMLVREGDAKRVNEILIAYMDNPQAEPAE